MALVTQIMEVQKERQRVHEIVECSASVFDAAGRRFLQLDTYGSADRKHKGKVSQALQFDHKGAEQLLRLIRQTFPDLA